MITRQLIRQKLPTFYMEYSPSFERVASREVSVNGVLSKTTVYEKFNPADEDKGVCYRDYILNNVLSLGNPELLNPCQMVESKSNGVSNLKKFNDDVKAASEKAQSQTVTGK